MTVCLAWGPEFKPLGERERDRQIDRQEEVLPCIMCDGYSHILYDLHIRFKIQRREVICSSVSVGFSGPTNYPKFGVPWVPLPTSQTIAGLAVLPVSLGWLRVLHFVGEWAELEAPNDLCHLSLVGTAVARNDDSPWFCLTIYHLSF
jgi:hypothetical protein